MSKYDALYRFLRQVSPDRQEITLTFSEIEKILGFPLPRSALTYREWWANPSQPRYHPHAQSWLKAGWEVHTVHLQNRQVCFRRTSYTHPEGGERETGEEQQEPGGKSTFQKDAAELLARYFGVEFQQEYPLQIGTPPRPHRFDLVSSDLKYVGECKDYSWTESGNSPSAKLASVNEAVSYLSFLPPDVVRFVALRKATHPRRTETLAEYYYRTYGHLLRGVLVLEVDLEKGTVRQVGEDR